MSEAESDGIWMDGGIVAERTNIVINRLIASMREQDAYRISKSGLDDVIRKVVGVSGDDTLRQYRENVVEHGPFTARLGQYTLKEGHRDE